MATKNRANIILDILGYISTIDWTIRLILFGFSGGAGVVTEFFAGKYMPLYYSIPLAVFALMATFGIIAFLIKAIHKPTVSARVEKATPIEPQNKVTFYPRRNSVDTATEFIKRHKTIDAIFGSGQLFGTYSIYERFGGIKNLILLKPHGNHFKEYSSKYYTTKYDYKEKDVRDKEQEISDNIVITTNKALPHIVHFFYRDDCLPFSMMIGDSESKSKDGEVLLELHIPHSEADERPTIIFKEIDYPDLFETLKKSYEIMRKESEQIK